MNHHDAASIRSDRGTASRTALLGLSVLVLLALVLWRGVGDGVETGQDADEALSPKRRYLDAMELNQRQDALIASADRWRAARVEAEERWRDVRSQLVRGRTPELAAASFRERVLGEVKDLKFLSSKAGATAAPGGQTGAGRPGQSIQPVALKVEVDADNPESVYRLVDRLENLPDIRATVTQLRLVGPGFRQTPGQLSVEFELRALALIGDEG